ncbi:MAG: sigma-70 family RNA polymerase sigma factor [Gemmatimonadales bacterium]|nr:MAG: sigma-70 family RNA polymerase sigma factor [Gemmatimonadales bacterium]
MCRRSIRSACGGLLAALRCGAGYVVSYADKDDKQLVILCRRGDERAARELVNRFQRPVFSIIYRMVRDREKAEDLAQETFVRTFNNLDRYDRSYKFSSWLFKIAYNLTVDHLRRKELRTISIHGSPDAVTADQQEATSVTLESTGETADDRLESLELADQLEEAIGKLREEYRTAILLRHVEGRAYEEIAEIMDIPLGTVKTYIFRARRQLREDLSTSNEGPEN